MHRLLGSLAVLFTLTCGAVALSGGPALAQAPVPPPAAAPQTGALTATFSVSAVGAVPGTANAHVHDSLVFDATQSQGLRLTYTWNFGDGTPLVSGPRATHPYGLVDDYTASLTVADATGQTASSTQTLRIAPVLGSLFADPPLKQVVPGAIIPAQLYIQAPGPSEINASLNGSLINGKPVAFSTPDTLAYVVLSGQVATETVPIIDQQIVQTPGGSIPLKGNVGLDLSYKTSAGKDVDLLYNLDLQRDPNPAKGIWAITYPNLSLVTGVTDPSQPDVNGYYLKGDAGFHHGDDPLVRKYALQGARAGGAFPDDPAQVMENLYAFSGGLFASDDPAQIEPDSTVAQKIANGSLTPGGQAQTYICISQTYFLASLSRTLGLPSRELTIALANPVNQTASGSWTVDYVQEGAAEVWFANSWHLYDTWLHIRNLDDYLIRKYALQAWYSYSAQTYNIRAKSGEPVNLYGHDFAIGEFEGVPADPNQWRYRYRQQRSGVSVEGFPTS